MSTYMDLNDEIETKLAKYSDMVRRICFIYLRSQDDVNDIFQEVFLKLLQRTEDFENETHERAWLIRVTINKCKDFHRSFWRRNRVYLEDVELAFNDENENELMSVVLTLPDKYKAVIYLFYYEGYTVPQMAQLLNKNENTIYSQLHRARELLKEKLGGVEGEYTF